MPLHWNFGGILQNYALSSVIRRFGHEPITIHYQKLIPVHQYLLSTLKTMMLRIFSSSKRQISSRHALSICLRGRATEDFVLNHIELTEEIDRYKSSMIERYDLSAVITGSDQVWRPGYNSDIFDMFLSFTNGLDIKRIAYAASFGVDFWEFSENETKKCAELAAGFDFISVREKSAVLMCKDYLHADAVCALDPTLLLERGEYEDLCSRVEKCDERFVAAYVLDSNPNVRQLLAECGDELSMPIRTFSSRSDSKMTVEQWLAMFRDCDYVITDSFHGTVFSIIFHKPFICCMNVERGASRFQSLLGDLGIEDRVVDNIKMAGQKLQATIDWEKVDYLLSARRQECLGYLENALN